MGKINTKEFFVVWKDPDFEGNGGFREYLDKRKDFIEKLNMNIYCITSTEKALKFILKMRKEKFNENPIFITNIGKDYSGKRLVEILREIYGFEIMVLFYSKNKKHLEWIQKFNNCLYTNKPHFFKKFIENYYPEGLKSLKKEIEDHYKVTLNFNNDFLNYNKNNTILFPLNEDVNPFIRHVKILSKNKKKYICMTYEGNVEDNDFGNPWDVTIKPSDKTITFFSNGFYLWNLDDDILGSEEMIIWNYAILDENENIYSIISKENKKFLSVKGQEIKLKESIEGDSEKFQFIDVNENNGNLIEKSFISKGIFDVTSSKILSESSSFL